MAEFSMELNDDQKTLQEWVHGFAVNQMRPIAAEWDEREETPWEFIQEAAKVGIYSVSYTHLDVYKRQSPRCPSRPGRRRIRPARRADPRDSPPGRRSMDQAGAALRRR